VTTFEWATWVGSAGTFLILGSLILLWRQNRTFQRSIQSSTYQFLMQNEATYHQIMIKDPALDRIVYAEDWDNEQTISDEDIRETKSYWVALLILAFFENIYVQREDFKLIPDHLWRYWQAYIEHDMRTYSRLREVLKDNKETYPYLSKFL